MATYVFIYEGGEVVGFERRPSPLKDFVLEGKKVVDVIRNAGQAINELDAARDWSLLGTYVLESERSSRLTDEQRREIRVAALNFDYFTDSVVMERRTAPVVEELPPPQPLPRIFDHGPTAPEADRTKIGIFDP